MPLRTDNRNYSTYQELTGLATPTDHDGHLVNYFYLYRYHGLGCRQMEHLRRKLIETIDGGKNDE